MSTDPLAQCAYCPRLCNDVCPAIRGEGRETVGPFALMTLLLMERQGQVPSDAHLGEVLQHCVACGRCTEACLHDATPWEHFLSGRMRLPAPGDKAHGASAQADRRILWHDAPFQRAGQGGEPWLLLGTLAGLDPAGVKTALDRDVRRSWRLPRKGLPLLFYRAWATGEGELFDGYVQAVAAELERLAPAGVAWSDPHEGAAVRAVLDAAGYAGERGYAPRVLGIVRAEATACGDLRLKYGCCGAAGGYPHAAPEAAGRLAERFEVDAGVAVPGICCAHLAKYGRTGYATDWDRA